MKRIVALLLALLALALPALAEPMSTFDYTDDILEDGSLIYYFPEISLRLPADWRGKVMAIQEESGASFYQIASYDKYQAEGIDGGGFLFQLGASVNGSFSQLPAFEYLGFSERSNMNYFLVLPTDYPAYNEPDIRAEYDAMYAELDFVAANAEVYPAQIVEDGLPGAEGGESSAFTPGQVRYHFEHSALPRFFYESPEDMLNGILDVGVYRVWESLATENGVDPTYAPGDFAEHWFASDDGAVLLQVELPEPDATTLCYRVYFVYKPDTAEAVYYTVEYDEFSPEAAFVCTWDAQRNHTVLGGAPVLDPSAEDYGAALLEEAEQIAALAGISTSLTAVDAPVPTDVVDDSNLVDAACPELGFSTKMDSACTTRYEEGSGLYIYTETDGSIPYVLIWQSGDLIAEPLEYIKEQYTPHMQQQYGDDLVSFVEYEYYEIGGKQLPAGLYTYRLQGHMVDALRIYDSTGDQTVVYTAKYLNGEGDATLAALDTAIRGYRAE